MERELAKSYVRYGMESLWDFSKKLCCRLLPVNLGCSVLALILCHDLIFSITVGLAVAANVITSFVYRARWSVRCGFLSIATQFLFFAISLDQCAYAMYQMGDLFVWYKYLAALVVQLFSVFVNIIIVVSSVKRFRGDKIPWKIPARMGWIVGSTTAAFSSVCLKVFFKDISLSVVLDILLTLITIIVVMSVYRVIAACSRVYLIRKYHLNFDEKEEEGEASDERD